MQQPISVRKATVKDVDAVLALIRELATFERIPEAVKLDNNTLLTDGFGPNPAFALHVAECNGAVVGMALFYPKYSTWEGKCLFLEDLVVSQAHRRQGIGAQLFESVMEVATQLGVARLEWQVLDWNAPAIDFYKRYDAALDSTWINGKLTAQQLQKQSKQ